MLRLRELTVWSLVLSCGGLSSRHGDGEQGDDGAAAAGPSGGATGGTKGGGAKGGTGAAPNGAGGTNGARAGRAGAAAGGSAGHAGAGATAGASGVGRAGAPPDRDCGFVIDDMEDGSGYVCEGSGRVGAWYAFNDGKGTQWPAPTTPGVPIEVSLLDVPRGQSEHAIHTYGRDFGSWGAGVGVDLAFDGTTYGLYDASAYSGITFWVRGDSQILRGGDQGSALSVASALPTISFRVSDRDSTYVDWGGTSMSKIYGPHVGIFPEETWTQYFVPFQNLRGQSDRFDPSVLTNLQWLTRESPFDFWVDDVEFYSGVADCCTPSCGGGIAFHDSFVEGAVANGAGVPGPGHPVTCETVCTATGAYMAGESYFDLSGLECVEPLAAITLQMTVVSDVSPLSALPHLASASLSYNAIRDPSPLAKLPALHALDLSGNPLDGVEGLGAAPSLAILKLNDTPLTAVDFDGRFRALTSLELNYDYLSDLTFHDLPELATLVADGSHLVSVDLALPRLGMLTLSSNQITTLRLDAPALTSLDLSGNHISDLAALTRSPALESLRLDGNPAADFSWLAALPELVSASLRDTGMHSADLAHLASQQLGTLILAENPIDDIAALTHVGFAPANASSSIWLDLSSTAVTDLHPLVENPSFENGTLSIADTPVDCSAEADDLAALAVRGIAVSGQCVPASP
ncbi:MAG TPA: leucine-rich repeat domain-containing protein [Polyangiaceae bacterium]|nr:leucine-rich repeat domain-containing protein [Polyangiaceae bacterium]